MGDQEGKLLVGHLAEELADVGVEQSAFALARHHSACQSCLRRTLDEAAMG